MSSVACKLMHVAPCRGAEHATLMYPLATCNTTLLQHQVANRSNCWRQRHCKHNKVCNFCATLKLRYRFCCATTDFSARRSPVYLCTGDDRLTHLKFDFIWDGK
jgi:hypothetical protein